MEIKNVEVYGFRAAIRGMRNSHDSWDKSDTVSVGDDTFLMRNGELGRVAERPNIGPRDLNLMKSLIKAGGSHRKFMRQIIIWCDLILPRYVLTELDTYKVATVRNSCSTMHTIHKRGLCEQDFEDCDINKEDLERLNKLIRKIQSNRTLRQEGEEFFLLKKRLPEGLLQLTTFTFSYETALNMYRDRKGHRLPEWNAKEDNTKYSICKFIEDLPYAKELIVNPTKEKE